MAAQKFTSPERLAWAAAQESHARLNLHPPHNGNERPLPADTPTDAHQLKEFEDYKECLDVITYSAHSVREVQPRSRWLRFGDIALSSAVPKPRRRQRRNLSRQFEDLLKRLNRRRLEFLHNDVDLGLTMAHIAALAESGSAIRSRNLRKARLAYETVLRFRHKVDVSAAEHQELQKKLIQLQTILVNLA